MATNGIAVIGAGMIGAAHAAGYRTYLPRIGGLSARLDVVSRRMQSWLRSWHGIGGSRVLSPIGAPSSTTRRLASSRSACRISCIPR